jgi:hypothetical protein
MMAQEAAVTAASHGHLKNSQIGEKRIIHVAMRFASAHVLKFFLALSLVFIGAEAADRTTGSPGSLSAGACTLTTKLWNKVRPRPGGSTHLSATAPSIPARPAHYRQRSRTSNEDANASSLMQTKACRLLAQHAGGRSPSAQHERVEWCSLLLFRRARDCSASTPT